LKLRWPFVDKGGYALASVMGRDDPGKFGLLYGKAIVDRGIETTVNGGQRSTYGKRWFGCKHFSQSQRFGKQTRTGHDSVYQSEAGGFFRVKHSPRKDEFKGRFSADVPRQALRPTEGWNDADVNLGFAECGGIRRHCQMGGLDQLTAASISQPIDCRDNWFRIRFNPSGKPMTRPHEMGDGFGWASLDMLLKAIDIRPSAEGSSGTSNHNNPDAGVELDPVEFCHHGIDQIVIKRVELAGTVKG
jgi:hypothetical protein